MSIIRHAVKTWGELRSRCPAQRMPKETRSKQIRASLTALFIAAAGFAASSCQKRASVDMYMPVNQFNSDVCAVDRNDEYCQNNKEASRRLFVRQANKAEYKEIASLISGFKPKKVCLATNYDVKEEAIMALWSAIGRFQSEACGRCPPEKQWGCLQLSLFRGINVRETDPMRPIPDYYIISHARPYDEIYLNASYLKGNILVLAAIERIGEASRVKEVFCAATPFEQPLEEALGIMLEACPGIDSVVALDGSTLVP